MQIFWPSQNFITVSITGQDCELMCQHCQSRFLKHMEPAETPEKLWALASKIDAKGMLISGGSDQNGAVPILPYLDIIKNIKEQLNISINL
ncbi:MAG: radical SAM protein, partial [Thermoplasmata archaeon]|nr:radical SAM protein [Thermoplasmata archaeon]